jgi:hypothetical protein
VRSLTDPDELLSMLAPSMRSERASSSFSELCRPVVFGFLFPAIGGMLYGVYDAFPPRTCPDWGYVVSTSFSTVGWAGPTD